ncbi:hypothetical protein EW145_g3429 [Phellinidium pouzarii]|uniref:Uncharacterized protein n=1 Tax=Phellinidium pouzarii TaxID=167371 RepID=A0A4S4L7Q1_9AGAM|nr:hypothetical protein EW145_g3429 [Phellinidium pouzarii]
MLAMNTITLRRLAASRRAFGSARPALQRLYSTPAKDPQLGDYPQLPDVSRAVLPPTGWWDNQMRRNFGDTLHEKDELYSMWGLDVPKVPPKTALFQFGIAASLFGSIMLFAYLSTPEMPAVKRSYPYDGLVKELGGLEENRAKPESLEADEE